MMRFCYLISSLFNYILKYFFIFLVYIDNYLAIF